MRTKLVHRHYCDFCGRGMFRKPDMEKHERKCTMNPDRVCGLCDEGNDMAKLVALLPDPKAFRQTLVILGSLQSEYYPGLCEATKEAIEKLPTECPVCIFAALRQRGLAGMVGMETFDLKKKTQEWWDAENQRELMAEQWG